MRFSASEVAAATGGQLVGDDVRIDGASHDSRAVQPGELFVPIEAERDGHDFIDDAVGRGAAAVLSADPSHLADGVPTILVANTLDALLALGRAARERISGTVVGITGSVGKTTAKDLIRGVLSVDGTVHASAGNFNNEMGVPLTLLAAPDDARRVVVEMGARGIGHISLLCGIARPDVGVVTRVAMAHGEVFGTIDDIARGKSELIEHLPASGTAVLNAGDPRVAAMAEVATARVLTFGINAGEVRVTRIDVAADLQLSIRLETPWGSTDVSPTARGPHNAENAAAAAAVGLALGVDLADVATGLERAEMSPLRMALGTTPSGAVVLDDSYNANPASMRAALDALAHVPATRHVAVLGVMAELGDDSDAEHEAIATVAAAQGVELIMVDAPQYRAGAHGGREVASIDEALEALGPVGEGDAVLAKGSRVAGLDRLVVRLLER